MPHNRKKPLSLMIRQYRERHGRPPKKIVICPVALMALGIMQSVGVKWDGVPVESRLFGEGDICLNGPVLGVFSQRSGKTIQLRSCELKT